MWSTSVCVSVMKVNVLNNTKVCHSLLHFCGFWMESVEYSMKERGVGRTELQNNCGEILHL